MAKLKLSNISPLTVTARCYASLIVSVVIPVFVLSSFVSAQGFDDFSFAEEIKIIIGETDTLPVKNPQQVKIGNPSILDVVGAGQGELLLDGKQAGETSLVVIDALGEHRYLVKVYAADLGKIKERLDFLLQSAGFNLETTIADKERKVYVAGTLEPDKQEMLENQLARFEDSVVNLVTYEEKRVSVHIDVEILDFDKDALDNLGIDWTQTYVLKEGGGDDAAVTDNTFSDLKDPVLFFRTLADWRTTGLQATINMLKTQKKIRTLSRPKIRCLSGETATLTVGGEVPVITGTNTSEQGTVTYNIAQQEYGIMLNITPFVYDSGEIKLEIATEVSEIDSGTALQLSDNTSTPGLLKSEAKTWLTVQDGQTVFIAGLIKSKRTDSRSGLQGLERIPLLGVLFRSKDLHQEDREIVITLSPTIIRNGNDALASPGHVANVPLPNNFVPAAHREETTRNEKNGDSLRSYLSLIQNMIYSHIRYPKELKKQTIEGTVKLSLRIADNGDLLGVIIMNSSGHPILDDAAEQTVKSLSPFPAFPPDVAMKELWVDIPIVYTINNNA